MPLQGWRWLDSGRFKLIIQTAASKLDATGWPMLFLDRVPVVDAFDSELFGRYTQKLIAADLVANDQQAVVEEAGQIQLLTHELTNIKRGVRLGQHLLNRLDQIREYGTVLPRDTAAIDDLFFDIGKNLVLGVKQRLNQLACAMLCDSLHYDRRGIKLDLSWGMPANLKVVAGTTWDQTTATPLTDILTVADQTAVDAYGMTFNRVTMSSKAFTYMTSTTEFVNKAKIMFGFDYGTGGLNVADRPAMQKIAGRLLEKTVEIYDAVLVEKNEDGTTTRTRVLPQNKVLLTNDAYDKNGTYYDIGNGVVTESLVSALAGEAPGGVPTGMAGGRELGPVGYYEARMNPPDLTAWAVQRAFPRKYVPESSSVLVVGNLGTAQWPG
jgi:hypothetical protein